MSRYRYGDLILEAFMEFRRPMALEEVIEYVAEMTDKTVEDVRLSVDNTLTAAWLHGFVSRDDELYYLESGIKPMANEADETCSTGSTTTFATFTGRSGRRLKKRRYKRRGGSIAQILSKNKTTSNCGLDVDPASTTQCNRIASPRIAAKCVLSAGLSDLVGYLN